MDAPSPWIFVNTAFSAVFGGVIMKVSRNVRTAKAAKEWKELAEAREKKIADLQSEVAALKRRVDELEQRVQDLLDLNIKLQRK